MADTPEQQQEPDALERDAETEDIEPSDEVTEDVSGGAGPLPVPGRRTR